VSEVRRKLSGTETSICTWYWLHLGWLSNPGKVREDCCLPWYNPFFFENTTKNQYIKLTDVFTPRCATYVPSAGCTLVSDPSDPICCKVPYCAPQPNNTAPIPTAPTGVITGGSVTLAPSPVTTQAPLPGQTPSPTAAPTPSPTPGNALTSYSCHTLSYTLNLAMVCDAVTRFHSSLRLYNRVYIYVFCGFFYKEKTKS